MGKEVELNGEVIEFPDSMPDSEIEAQLQQMHRQAAVMPRGNQQMATSEQFAQPPAGGGIKTAADAIAGRGAGPSTVGFLKNAYDELYGMGDALGGYLQKNAGKKPEDFIVGAAQDIGSQITPAKIADFIESRYNAYTGGNALGEIYNKPVSFLGDVAGVVGAAPPAARAAGQTGRAVAGAVGATPGPVRAAIGGAAEQIPVVGRMVRGARIGLERYGRASRPPPPPTPPPNAGGRLGGQAPSLESEIDKALRSMMEPEAPRTVTGQPETTITTPGKEGSFYSSGRPATRGEIPTEGGPIGPTEPPPVVPPTPEGGITFGEVERTTPTRELSPAQKAQELMDARRPGQITETGVSGADNIDELDQTLRRSRGETWENATAAEEPWAVEDVLKKEGIGPVPPPEPPPVIETGPVSADAPVTGDMMAQTEARLMAQADAEAAAQANRPAIVKQAERAAELENAKRGLPDEPKAAPPSTEVRPELPDPNVGNEFDKAKNRQVNDKLTQGMAGLTDEDIRLLDSFDDFGNPLSRADQGLPESTVTAEIPPEPPPPYPNLKAYEESYELGLTPEYPNYDPIKHGVPGAGEDAVTSKLVGKSENAITRSELPKPPRKPRAKKPAAPKASKPKPTPHADAYIEGHLKNTEKPTKWESGEKPGSPAAKRAMREHQETALMDELYRMLIEDPSK